MLADDFAHGCKPQAGAGEARGEERFEKVLQGRLLDAAPGVADDNAHVASRWKIAMGERLRRGDPVHPGFDLNPPHSVDRLCSVVAKIEKHLLQLRRLAGYDGCVRHLANNQLDPRRQRDLKQRTRLGDEALHTYGLSPHIPPPTKSEHLIDEITRPLSRAANLFEVSGRWALGREMCLGDLCMTEDRTDNVVEIVRDTAGESTDGFHAPGLLQASL